MHSGMRRGEVSRTPRCEQGQGLIEYVLVVSLVGIALIAALVLYRSSLAGLYNLITHRL